jgi:hypothetical protein
MQSGVLSLVGNPYFAREGLETFINSGPSTWEIRRMARVTGDKTLVSRVSQRYDAGKANEQKKTTLSARFGAFCTDTLTNLSSKRVKP